MEDGGPARLPLTQRGVKICRELEEGSQKSRKSYHSHTQLTINLAVTFAFPARAISVLVTAICCIPECPPQIYQ
jgi:hypothetical protein